MRHVSCPVWLSTALVGWLAVVPAVAHAEAPLAIKGAELAIRWPQLLGKTVQISVTPVQALDAARYYVKVDEVSAVMIIMPDKVWSGRKTVCAMVLGPEKVHRGGNLPIAALKQRIVSATASIPAAAACRWPGLVDGSRLRRLRVGLPARDLHFHQNRRLRLAW